MVPVIEILNESIEAPDSPSDCALVIALPLERRVFLHELEEGPDENFARSFKSFNGPRLTSDVVSLMYEKYANLANDVIGDVESLGVRVVRNAKLADFAEILRKYRVTTVIAHSRDAHFYDSDIIDAALLAAELDCADSEIRRRIREMGGAERENPGAAKTHLVEYLNRIVDGAQEKSPLNESSEGRVGHMTKTQLDWSRRRTALQQSLPRAFCGGNAIEFSEGFVPVGRVLDVIPTSFRGKLDLTSCNSTVFAEDVRKKCRSVLVIANEQSTSLDLRLAIYRQLIRRLSRHSEPYEDALYRIRKELIDT